MELWLMYYLVTCLTLNRLDANRGFRFVEKSVVLKQPTAHTPDNVQELQRTDNTDETVEKRQNMKKVQRRQTVIRNLPQLQKLDNVAVSSEEMVSFFQR